MVLGSQNVDFSAGSRANIQAWQDFFAPLVQSSFMQLNSLIEAIVSWTQATAGTKQFALAKEEFELKNGAIFPDDPFFEARTAYFLNFFLFQRPLAQETPYLIFMKAICSFDCPVTPRLFRIFTQLDRARHSIFQVNKVGSAEMPITDLMNSDQFTVTATNTDCFAGFGKNDIFQGFVFPYKEKDKDKAFLAGGLLFHPRVVGQFVKAFVHDAIAEKKMPNNEALSKLATIQLRQIRQPQIDPLKLYRAALEPFVSAPIS